MTSKKPQEIFLKDYTKPEFSLPKIHLEFDLYDEYALVKNTSEFKFCGRSQEYSPTDLKLNGTNLELISVKINNTEISGKNNEYEISEEFLTLKNVPEYFTLETVVKIYPEKNKQLMGLYMSDGMFCTQNEPEGFRNITYHLDRPDVMSLFTTTIIADQKKFPVMLSNGNCISTEIVENSDTSTGSVTRHKKVWEDPFKKPCYLFALVAGDLEVTEDSFTTMSGRKIPLQIFTDSKNKTRVSHAMQSLKKAMKWDEERFGREYDLDIFMIVAVDNFNSGAMENKGLNIFNSSAILCDQKSATDRDFQFIEAVVAHEYFHNWTGNRITCRDWFQLTLKEGLTVFRDAEFSADMGDATLKRIDDAIYMREGQFAEDAGPMAHPIQPQSFIQIENFYTQTVYEKGAEVIRMLQTLYGRENFRKALDFYFENFDGQAVTIHEFLYSFEQTLNIDLTQFKNSWYFQAGTPVVKISDEYDSEKNEYRITVEQSNPVGNANLRSLQKYTHYHFPLQYGLLDKNSGAEISAGMLEITKEKETFVIDLDLVETNCNSSLPDRTKPLISLLRNFSAPVKIEYKYSLEEDIFLFQHDTDLFNKYESGQRIARRMIQDIMKTEEISKNEEIFEQIDDIIAAYAQILENPEISDGLKAEFLSLPGLFSIVSPQETYDYHNAYDSKELYKSVIANALEEYFFGIFEEKRQELAQGKFSVSQKTIGKRALKNTCLSYISSLYQPEISEQEESKESELNTEISEITFQQFQKSNTMTEKISALAILCKINSPEKNLALESFKQEWKHDSLVINKWFGVQASSPEISVSEIQKLEKEEFFDIKNPNKIRALFGAFGRNKTAFHLLSEDTDNTFISEPYAYISQKILEIDSFNNKASSGLAHVFDEYAKLPEENQSLIQVNLQKILDSEISDALFEVVTKIVKSGE